MASPVTVLVPDDDDEPGDDDEPDEDDEPDGVVVVGDGPDGVVAVGADVEAAATVGSAGSRALKLRTAATPAMVLVRTMGARRMDLEGEGLVVDAGRGDAGGGQRRHDALGEAVGAADVHVPLGDVGDQAAQRRRVERDALARAAAVVRPA